MPHLSDAIFDISSIVVRRSTTGHEPMVSIRSFVAITADTVTITLRVQGCPRTFRAQISRDLLPELPEALGDAFSLHPER